MTLLLFGALGRFVTATINVLPTLAKQPETARALADIYPTLPLWWVPESWPAAVVSILLIVTGIYFVIHGKAVERMLKKF